MKEIWKAIEGYLDYKISNLGQVKSLKYGFSRILKPPKTGYHQITLHKDGFSKRCYVHVLVAEAFIGPRPSDNHVCNHEDGIKLHNDAENLEWITESEDTQHAHNLGLIKVVREGEGSPNAKLKNDDVKQIKRLLLQGIAQMQIAKIFKVSRGCIGFISKGCTWSHITL